jgi:hypothetical protein
MNLRSAPGLSSIVLIAGVLGTIGCGDGVSRPDGGTPDGGGDRCAAVTGTPSFKMVLLGGPSGQQKEASGGSPPYTYEPNHGPQGGYNIWANMDDFRGLDPSKVTVAFTVTRSDGSPYGGGTFPNLDLTRYNHNMVVYLGNEFGTIEDLTPAVGDLLTLTTTLMDTCGNTAHGEVMTFKISKPAR